MLIISSWIFTDISRSLSLSLCLSCPHGYWQIVLDLSLSPYAYHVLMDIDRYFWISLSLPMLIMSSYILTDIPGSCLYNVHIKQVKIASTLHRLLPVFLVILDHSRSSWTLPGFFSLGQTLYSPLSGVQFLVSGVPRFGNESPWLQLDFLYLFISIEGW